MSFPFFLNNYGLSGFRSPARPPAFVGEPWGWLLSSVILAWGQGADHGHVMRFAALSREVVRVGHGPVLVPEDLKHAEVPLSTQGLTVLQAPLWLGNVNGLRPPASFAETHAAHGLSEPIAARHVGDKTWVNARAERLSSLR